ncbi:MAG: ABC transporter permease [Chloroflexi bacterium]|nr:ABC transporter permease [Chloroflexota bacterium]
MTSRTEAPAQGIRYYSDIGLSALRTTGSWLRMFARRQPLGFIGLVILTVVFIIAIFGEQFANLLAPEQAKSNPNLPPWLSINPRALFQSPEWYKGYILGADEFGRDNLSRILVGTRASITVAVVAVATGSSLGFIIGLVSGYYADWRDAVLSRLVDMKMAIPTIVLALVIVAVLGQSQTNVIIAIALIQVSGMARIVRSVVLSTRTMEFVQAARALGATDWRIIWRHVAPQTFAPVLILVTSALGLAIIIESSLSFLGLGTPPPNPAWGAMLSGAAIQNVERAPWNAIFPGLALTFTVFSVNLLGDGLRDTLDPRLRV